MDYETVFELTFLQDVYLEELPNKPSIVEARQLFEGLQKTLNDLVEQARKTAQGSKREYKPVQSTWQEKSGKILDSLNKAIAQLPGQAGKTGKQLGAEYTTIIGQLTLIEKQRQQHKNQRNIVEAIESERTNLLETYRNTAFKHF